MFANLKIFNSPPPTCQGDNNVWRKVRIYFITPHPVLSVRKVGAAAGALAGGGAVLAADPSGALNGLDGKIFEINNYA